MIHIEQIKVYELELPLKTPFATAQGVYSTRATLIVELITREGLVGYGECEAFAEPWYTEETLETEKSILIRCIAPFITSRSWESPSHFAQAISWVKRHHFAKAGVEMALWDLYSQLQGQSIVSLIGGTRKQIEVGVVVGLSEHVEQALEQISLYEQSGYKRYKIKIKPGQDEAVVAAIRARYPNLPLMVDANSSYTLADAKWLARLDQYKLMMIEQPLGESDFLDHAQLQTQLKTPICLDESIHGYEDARLAIALKSCQVINVKLGRVGGLTEAIRIHDLCRAHHMPIWVGGMLESGVGRLHHIILASLEQFTIAGDISASEKYWEKDIIAPPVVVEHGNIHVPQQPGLGAAIDEAQLKAYTKRVLTL